MSQININPGHEPVEAIDTSGDRSAAAGINLITVVIVLGVLAVIAWYLFTGPLRGMGSASSTNVNVNPAPTTSSTTNINVNPPAVNVNNGQGTNPAPANNGTTNNQPAPAKP